MAFWLWYLFCGDAYVVFTSMTWAKKPHVLQATE